MPVVRHPGVPAPTDEARLDADKDFGHQVLYAEAAPVNHGH